MNVWKITYYDSPLGNTAFVKADMIRVSTQSGDLWFCDESDKKYANDYLPKFILAKGSYISIDRVEPKQEEIVIDLSAKMKKAMEKPSGPENDKVKWI